jgi:hypothetical protein
MRRGEGAVAGGPALGAGLEVLLDALVLVTGGAVTVTGSATATATAAVCWIAGASLIVVCNLRLSN